MSKLKGLFVSDLVAPTGFARVSHNIINNLPKEDYEIEGLGVNYRGDPHGYNFPIFPAALGGRVYGEDRLVQLLSTNNYDFIFILNDSWIVNTYLTAIKEAKLEKLPKIIVYFPVDSEFHDPSWYKNFDIVTTAVTYTKFGQQVVNDDTCVEKLDLEIIPHGVDKRFYKKFTNRVDAKEFLFGKTPNREKFIFLNANRNQPRKRLDITMEAFKLFSEDKNDVALYMHCGVRDAHIDVARLAVRLGIDSKLILTSLRPGIQTVPDETLNVIYNACEVGINTGLGEGWGLTSVEHAVTGAPQIVPNHSACAEIFNGVGELVKPKLNFTFDHSMTVGKLVDPVDVATSMNKLYSDKALYEESSSKSIAKFSQDEYSWEHIATIWDKVFKDSQDK
jgi:glycosyltransferase involved in cell wall biosynthesis